MFELVRVQQWVSLVFCRLFVIGLEVLIYAGCLSLLTGQALYEISPFWVMAIIAVSIGVIFLLSLFRESLLINSSLQGIDEVLSLRGEFFASVASDEKKSFVMVESVRFYQRFVLGTSDFFAYLFLAVGLSIMFFSRMLDGPHLSKLADITAMSKVFGAAALLILGAYLLSKRLGQLDFRIQRYSRRLASYLDETVDAFRPLVSDGIFRKCIYQLKCAVRESRIASAEQKVLLTTIRYQIMFLATLLVYFSLGDLNFEIEQLPLVGALTLKGVQLVSEVMSCLMTIQANKQAYLAVRDAHCAPDHQRIGTAAGQNVFRPLGLDKPIEFQGVEVRLKNKVIKYPPFTLRPGMNWLIGPSGVGKSSLLGVLDGTYYGNGVATIAGEKMGLDELRSRLSMLTVAQSSYILPESLAENLTVACEAVRGPGINHQSKVEDFKLSHLQESDLIRSNLSGGELTRIRVLRGLFAASSKDLIFFDEPTTGLNDEQSEFIMSEIRAISDNRTVLIVSHDHKYIAPSDHRIQL